MDWSNLAVFFIASWTLIITPGPDIIYVVTRGVSQGRRAGLVSAAGVTLGILVHTTFAAFGLAVILKTSAMAFLAVKFAGAGYLMYLGIKTFKNGGDFSLNSKKPKDNMGTIFVQGVLSNVLNPKVALFFLAFLPQFVSPGYGGTTYQMFCLGFTFASFGLLFLVLLGYFSGDLGSWLSSRPGFTEKIHWVTGGVLFSLGLRLAFIERR